MFATPRAFAVALAVLVVAAGLSVSFRLDAQDSAGARLAKGLCDEGEKPCFVTWIAAFLVAALLAGLAVGVLVRASPIDIVIGAALGAGAFLVGFFTRVL